MYHFCYFYAVITSNVDLLEMYYLLFCLYVSAEKKRYDKIFFGNDTHLLYTLFYRIELSAVFKCRISHNKPVTTFQSEISRILFTTVIVSNNNKLIFSISLSVNASVLFFIMSVADELKAVRSIRCYSLFICCTSVFGYLYFICSNLW